ncbi:MAG: SMC-Scp complex subunit ScpB [Candidatus Neomarinimicrobiota bacterium]
MSTSPMNEELLQIAEALLTASPEPLTQVKFNQSLERDDVRLSDVVTALKQLFHEQQRPVDIMPLAGGYQLVTRAEYQPYLRRLLRRAGPISLSRAALETLAVVAYRQPVTRAELDQVRGVNCESVLRTLLEKTLVTVRGRDEGVGRPLLYGTTKGFLQAFGLNNLSDLPRLREVEEIMGAERPPPLVDHAAE